MATTATDRIEKTITLRAPRSRVWRALTDTEEFGTWFGARLAGGFVAGATVTARITLPGYEHVVMEMLIERVEPERHFAYRWHPHAVERGRDYSQEPMTLVEFTLEDAGTGTILTIVESGFDRLSPARRAEAFPLNTEGWASELRNIERHVSQP